MSKGRRKRKSIPRQALQLLAAEKLNGLYQRTRPKGERIPARPDPIEPDRGENL